MKNSVRNASLALLFALFLFSPAYAQSEAGEGYDENTEVTIRGNAKEVARARETRGPVIIVLKSGNRDYKVVTGPPWYLAQEGIELKVGTSYEVTGSKFIARDGNVYIAASRLKDLSTGSVWRLRDSSCMPLWKGRGMRKGSRSGN